jgi:hypothetical protein
LHDHIAQFHSHLLPGFEAGWEALSPNLKGIWFQEATQELDHNWMLEEWTSWAFYAHTTSMAHRIRQGYNEVGLFNFMKKSIPVPSDVTGRSVVYG